MSSQRRLMVIGAAVLCALIAVFVWENDQPSRLSPAEVESMEERGISVPPVDLPGAPTSLDAIDPARVRTATTQADGTSLLPESSELVATLNTPSESPENDLEIVQNLLATYRGIFGSNPPGGLNSEIVASMLGANERKLAIIPRNLAALSPKGELLDRWGTPFFFHPVSAEILEVMSAGPDQMLWTPDDVGNITEVAEL